MKSTHYIKIKIWFKINYPMRFILTFIGGGAHAWDGEIEIQTMEIYFYCCIVKGTKLFQFKLIWFGLPMFPLLQGNAVCFIVSDEKSKSRNNRESIFKTMRKRFTANIQHSPSPHSSYTTHTFLIRNMVWWKKSIRMPHCIVLFYLCYSIWSDHLMLEKCQEPTAQSTYHKRDQEKENRNDMEKALPRWVSWRVVLSRMHLYLGIEKTDQKRDSEPASNECNDVEVETKK